MSLIGKLVSKGRPCCTAPTGRGGKHCGNPLRPGRFHNGHTCGKYACQLWLSTRQSAA